jgi:hypothetical protein
MSEKFGLRFDFEMAVKNSEIHKPNFFWMILNWLLSYETWDYIRINNEDLFKWAKPK